MRGVVIPASVLAAVLTAAATASAGSLAEPAVTVELAGTPTRLRPLPFDPLTLQRPPPDFWDELGDQLGNRRFWAAALVGAGVKAGLVDGTYAPRLVELTEAIMKRPELNLDFRFRQQPQTRLRLQLKVVKGKPRASVILVW
jgi:hypothetical protein